MMSLVWSAKLLLESQTAVKFVFSLYLHKGFNHNAELSGLCGFPLMDTTLEISKDKMDSNLIQIYKKRFRNSFPYIEQLR